jgi:uncharacterized protein with gpF-like domain
MSLAGNATRQGLDAYIEHIGIGADGDDDGGDEPLGRGRTSPATTLNAPGDHLREGRMRKRAEEKTLRAVWPNAALRAAYRAKLEAIVEAMARSYVYFLKAQYRETPPRMMAMDATPAKELQRELRKLGDRWETRVDELAPKLAAWFAKSANARSDRALQKILRDAGFSVRFQMTKAMRDILDATVANQVSLIKSIQSEYHTQVESLVMQSVTAGRDLDFLTTELQKRYGITRRRAAMISLDQNNKASSALRRAREVDIGLDDAIWLHSHAGVTPRRTHLANDGKKFSLRTGWYDPDPKVRRYILPGELISCRCSWRPIAKGFS